MEDLKNDLLRDGADKVFIDIPNNFPESKMYMVGNVKMSVRRNDSRTDPRLLFFIEYPELYTGDDADEDNPEYDDLSIPICELSERDRTISYSSVVPDWKPRIILQYSALGYTRSVEAVITSKSIGFRMNARTYYYDNNAGDDKNLFVDKNSEISAYWEVFGNNVKDPLFKISAGNIWRPILEGWATRSGTLYEYSFQATIQQVKGKITVESTENIDEYIKKEGAPDIFEMEWVYVELTFISDSDLKNILQLYDAKKMPRPMVTTENIPLLFENCYPYAIMEMIATTVNALIKTLLPEEKHLLRVDRNEATLSNIVKSALPHNILKTRWDIPIPPAPYFKQIEELKRAVDARSFTLAQSLIEELKKDF